MSSILAQLKAMTDVVADTGDIERLAFNTAIAAVMELCNALGRVDGGDRAQHAVRQEALEAIVKMLAPIAPHICDALWSELGHGDLLLDVAWPIADESALVRATLTLVVQVNGKRRGDIEVSSHDDEDTIKQAALALEAVRKRLQGRDPKKVILVPGRLVNVVG